MAEQIDYLVQDDEIRTTDGVPYEVTISLTINGNTITRDFHVNGDIADENNVVVEDEISFHATENVQDMVNSYFKKI